jgi:transposase-like protein
MKSKEKYSDYFKRKVVQEVLSGKISKEEARRIYKIRSKSAILEWMRIFVDIPRRSAGTDPVPALKEIAMPQENTEELKAKIKLLEEQLKVSELKGRAYQIMLEIAKEGYGLDLEKKPGAKQSKKSNQKTQK